MNIHLEQFPNEIFHEIFKYLSLYDLYHGFFNLNQRINHILQSVTQLSLILDKPEQFNDASVSFFASRVYHLVIKYPYAVPFKRFPSVRSLTSLCPCDRQLRSIKSKYLPNLTRLTLGFSLIWDCDIMGDLCQKIISNEFPKLRYCSLWPPAFEIDSTRIQTPLLTHMELKEGNLDDLCVALDSCPNLRYIKMLVSIYAKSPTKLVQNLSVKRLDVSFIPHDPDWIKRFDELLSLLPNLKHLFLKICVINIDFDHLSRILKQRVIHLCSIQCDVHANMIPIRFNSIQRYHPLFQNIDFEDIDDEEKCSCDGLKLCINGKRKN